MRDYTGISFATLPKTDTPDFVPRLRSQLATIDYFLRDLSRGMGRIQNGEVPDGSGNPIPGTGGGGAPPDVPGAVLFVGPGPVLAVDGDNFFWDDSNNRLGIGTNAPGVPLHLKIPSVGNIQRWEMSTVPALDLTAEANGAATDYVLVTTTSGSGLQLRMNDATSGVRFTSETGRAFMEFGKLTGGVPAALRGVIAGFNQVKADDVEYRSDLHYFVSRTGGGAISLSSRVAINLDLTEFSTTQANRGSGLHIGPFAGITATDPAPLILETSSGSHGQIEIRALSSAAPARVVGAMAFRICRDDGLLWFDAASAGARRGRIQPILSGTGSGGFNFLNNNDRLGLGLLPVTGAFSDVINTTTVQAGNATDGRSVLFSADGGNLLARYGICATSVVIGPRTSGALPGPVSSRVLTLVDGSSNVLFAVLPSGATLIDLPATGAVPLTVEKPTDTGTNYLSCFDASIATNVASIDGLGQFNLTGATPIVSWFGSGVIGTGDFVALDFSNITAAAGGTTIGFPTSSSATVSIVTTAGTQTLTNKTVTLLAVASSFRSNTAASGTSFADTTTTTKRLRMVLSGAVGDNAFTLTNTAARNYGFGDLSGNVVVVGDDPPAVASGGLGKVDLTAQTANITTTNLSNTPPVGSYDVEIYLMCTTADAAAGTLTVTIGWTDNVGATTSTPITGFSLATTGRTTGRQIMRVNSGDITYAVAVTGSYGTAQYAIYVRTITMG